MQVLNKMRMLRNQEGGSPGGGAAPPASPPSTPATPPAQGAGASSSDIDAKLDAKFEAFHGRIFADLRKANVFGKGKEPEPAPARPPEGGASAGALSRDDVTKMLERRDALHGAMSGVAIPEGARQRMLRAFEQERPDDPGAWAKGYIADFGLDKQTPGAAPAGTSNPSPPKPPPGPPASGGGGVPPPSNVTDDTPIWKWPQADVEHLRRTKGPAEVLKRYRESMRQVGRIRVRNY